MYISIIDKNNNYVDFGLKTSENIFDDDNNFKGTYLWIEGYLQQEGEKIVDIEPPKDKNLPYKLVKNKWILQIKGSEIDNYLENKRLERLKELGLSDFPPESKKNILETAVFELAEELALKDKEIQELKQGQEETNEALFELAEMIGG